MYKNWELSRVWALVQSESFGWESGYFLVLNLTMCAKLNHIAPETITHNETKLYCTLYVYACDRYVRNLGSSMVSSLQYFCIVTLVEKPVTGKKTFHIWHSKTYVHINVRNEVDVNITNKFIKIRIHLFSFSVFFFAIIENQHFILLFPWHVIQTTSDKRYNSIVIHII